MLQQHCNLGLLTHQAAVHARVDHHSWQVCVQTAPKERGLRSRNSKSPTAPPAASRTKWFVPSGAGVVTALVSPSEHALHALWRLRGIGNYLDLRARRMRNKASHDVCWVSAQAKQQKPISAGRPCTEATMHAQCGRSALCERLEVHLAAEHDTHGVTLCVAA
jgi:hypothetical protein